ncbi:RNA-directed DNA polymerase, eukaryota [Tanacetum coccineum]
MIGVFNPIFRSWLNSCVNNDGKWQGHRSNNYSESKRNDHLDNNRRQEQRNKGIPNKSHPNFREEHKSFSSIFVSNIPWNASVQDLWDILDMSGKYGTSYVGAESVGVSDCNKVYKEAGNEAVMSISVDDCIDLDGYGAIVSCYVKDLSFDSVDQVESVKTSKALKEIFLEFKDVSHDFIPDERCVWIDLVGLPLASWAPEVYKKLGVSVGSSVFTDMDCMEKELKDDAGEILGVHSQGDCGNVTTDDSEDVTPVIAPRKYSIIAPPSTPPGNDLNIAVESGSSWIDYIGPLTSDEIDSDKRWSYRDPNGNIHGLTPHYLSRNYVRGRKDYFPSDLQIWSYYWQRLRVFF